MALTDKEKQARYRARMKAEGLKAVQGIYLPDDLHKPLKDYARELLRTRKKTSDKGN